MIYNNNYYIKPFRKNIKINIIRMLSNKIYREKFLKKEEELNLQKKINENFYIVNRNESIYIDKGIEDNIEKSYVLLKNNNNDHKINLNLKS
jgi:hypothetical protein